MWHTLVSVEITIFTAMTSYCTIAKRQMFVRVESEGFLLVLGNLAQRLLRRKLPERQLYVSSEFWAMLRSHFLSVCIAIGVL